MMEDILLDDEGNFVIAVDGDMETVTGLECLVQDVKHRLATFPGGLWLHLKYGAEIPIYEQSLDTEMNRLELEQAIRLAIQQDEKVDPNSISVTINTWTRDQIEAQVSFSPAEGFNDDSTPATSADIIITIGNGQMEVTNL